MRDFKRYFQRRYSAVSTNNVLHGPDLNNLRRKSLQASKSITSNFNILDSFFNKRKNGTRTRSPKCGFLLLAVGLLCISTGILIKIFQPYDLIFKWKLTFSEGGEIFSLWEKPPVDLYIKIYLFNITNPDEYMAGKEKMKVQEIGPYVYKELMAHNDIEFNDNNTVSTKPAHPLVWQEHLSQGHQENDTVVMLNIALLSIAQVASEKSYFYRLPINLLIRNTKSQPLVKMTAREFMFGFETSLTTLGNTFLSDWIYFDKVGLIDRMYDFNNDYETFYTGKNDSSISGLYASYMGSKNLPQWNGEHCSDIEYASDGAKFKSFIQPDEKLKFFRKSMCRPQTLVRVGNLTELNGFNTYKYVFEDNALDNGQFDERNKCYCKGKCQPKGLVDVHECYYGFPISLSYPHFMDADTKIIEDLEGVQPDPSKHSSYFMIEPNSGLPIRLSVKFQINMHFRDISSMAHVEKFSYKTIPMVWFEIAFDQLPESLTNRFNLYLNILPLIDTYGIWIPLSIGIILLLIAIINAIIKIPSFFPALSYKSSNHNDKYAKVNLKSNVYNACEVKLIEMNEKSFVQRRRSSSTKIQTDKLNESLNLIQNEQFNNSSSNNSSNEDDDIAQCKIDFNINNNDSVNGNKYMLEDLPALLSEDEWVESNSQSSRSSDQTTLDIDFNGDKDDHCKDINNQLIFDHDLSNDSANIVNENFMEKPVKNKCLASTSTAPLRFAETSSLIDDIGNNKFNDDFDNLLHIREDDSSNLLKQNKKLFLNGDGNGS